MEIISTPVPDFHEEYGLGLSLVPSNFEHTYSATLIDYEEGRALWLDTVRAHSERLSVRCIN